ncbi:hypothetical protein PV10_02261 [Exophiala mesophila]|uniref:Uncharacterized protein n=1 Tax=Exophiala mesophila TaxID=212818 RepID=A0A0D2A6D9_EXOME|nr:uncharacterized protein PV10_02261 [Exophiala mesophila]KIV94498.1 hypothetical protein PV10_02261 [Exophiala mesophila]
MAFFSHRDGYKPASIRSAYMIALVFLNVLFVSLAGLSLHAKGGTSINETLTADCPDCLGAPPPSSWTNFLNITTGEYFLGTYLAPITAVLYRVLWSSLHRNLLLATPYRHLLRPEGASAAETVCFEPNGWAGIFGSLKHGKKSALAIIAAILTLLTTLAVPISSEAVTFKVRADVKGGCSASEHNGDECTPSLAFNKTLLGVLLGIAVLDAAFLTVLAWSARRLKSVLSRDPSSIAAVASLMGHPTVSAALKGIPGNATSKTIRDTLRGTTWRLAASPSSSSLQLIVTQGLPAIELQEIEQADSIEFKYNPDIPYSPTSQTESQMTELPDNSAKMNRKRWTRRTLILGLFVILAAVFSVVAYYRWTRDLQTGLEHFMDSQRRGVRFLWTTIGLGISAGWSVIEYEARQQEPYQRLLRGPTAGRDSIMMTTTTLPVTALPTNLVRRHWFLACMSLNAVLGDVITTTLAAIPYSSSTSYLGFQVSVIVSLAILGIMMLSSFWLLFRPHSILPRAPTSIAAIMTYLDGSSLVAALRGFVSTCDSGSGARGSRATEEPFRDSAALYAMQPIIDGPGITRLVVDKVNNGLGNSRN